MPIITVVFITGAFGLYHGRYPQKENAGASDVINSANRIIFWSSIHDCTTISDAQLDKLKSQGVGGLVCETQHLKGMGGSTPWNDDPNATLPSIKSSTGSELNAQLLLKNSQIGQRLRNRGMKGYLAFYMANYNQKRLAFPAYDAGWDNTLIPGASQLAGVAKLYGFNGVVFDNEAYTGGDWYWSSFAGGHSRADTEAKMKQRGQQLMQGMLSEWNKNGAGPGLELMTYDTQFNQTWEAKGRDYISGADPNRYVSDVQDELWDGLTSSEGYKDIWFLQAFFYKNAQVGGLEPALQYDTNSANAYMSRRFSDWNYAAGRVHQTPFIWIDSDCRAEGWWSRNRAPAAVANQLQEYRKWAPVASDGSGQFANFVYTGLNTDLTSYNDPYCAQYDSSYNNGRPYNYVPALQAAAQPGNVDDQPPTISVSNPPSGQASGNYNLSGIAKDNLAIAKISWKNDDGKSGAAPMTWHILSGDYNNGYTWQMEWSASIPLHAGTNRVTVSATDIKGLTTSTTLTFNGTGNPAPEPTPPPAPNPTPAPQLEILKTSVLPVINGDLSEYANVPAVSFSRGGANATVRSLWDNNNLYLAYHVTDSKAGAKTTTRDGAVWTDSAVEWFIDTANNRTAGMDGNDFQGIVNLLNTQYDAAGTASGAANTGWNGQWQSAVVKNASGFDIEVKIPWQTLAYTPAGNAVLGMDFAADSPSNGPVMWPDTTSGFQNAAKWQPVKLSNQIASTPSTTKPGDATNPPPPIVKNGDVNGDGKVDILDLSLIASNWHKNLRGRQSGDLNDDGAINIIDLSFLAKGWHQ